MLCEGEPSRVAMDGARVRRARDLLHSHVDDGNTPTLVAVVARHGVIVLAEAIGQRGSGLGPVHLDDPFNMFSLTKPFTATLVMMLAEDGLLSVNRPVVDYLPEMTREGNDRILLSHLLTHTSGFERGATQSVVAERMLRGEVSPPPAGVDFHSHAMLDSAWDTARSFDVGSRMVYSDHNYRLLGEVVRRVSGESLDNFSRRRIFEPLGMSSTGFCLDPDQAARRARRPPDLPGGQPYDEHRLPGPEASEWECKQAGNNGLKASTRDLAIFGQMFLNGGTYGSARLLSKASVAAMTRNQTPGVPVDIFGQYHPEAGWGYGWGVNLGEKWAYYISELESVGSFGHGGFGGAALRVDPARGLVIALNELASGFSDYGEAASGILDRFTNVVYSSLDD
jgi:CubicO group peptidase (beta-lactamase class C family)